MDGTNHLSWHCDQHTSSNLYRQRFAGRIGDLIIKRQNELLQSLLGDIRGKTVLDVGAGHAQLTPSFIAAGARVTAYGSSDEALSKLRDCAVSRATGPLYPLPFRDREFDIVVSVRTFSHVPDWKLFMGELCRVACDRVAFDFVSDAAFNLLKPIIYRLKLSKEPGTRDYTVQNTRELIAAGRDAGFPAHAREGEFLLPLVLHRMLKKPVLMPFEHMARFARLTTRLGGPIIMALRRENGR